MGDEMKGGDMIWWSHMNGPGHGRCWGLFIDIFVSEFCRWDGVFASGQPRGGVQGGVNCSCACGREGGLPQSFWAQISSKLPCFLDSSCCFIPSKLQQPFNSLHLMTCSNIVPLSSIWIVFFTNIWLAFYIFWLFGCFYEHKIPIEKAFPPETPSWASPKRPHGAASGGPWPRWRAMGSSAWRGNGLRRPWVIPRPFRCQPLGELPWWGLVFWCILLCVIL